MSTTLESRTRASLLVAAGNPANQAAQVAFAERYGSLIRDWCRRRGLQKADQDDVAQTILCRLFVWLSKTQYNSSKRFRGLLRIMISHAIADLHRDRQRHPGERGSGDTGILGQLYEVPAPDDPSVDALAQDLAGEVERDQQVQEACERVRQRVKPHTWQAFWLTTVENRPAAEVVQQLGMSESAVYVAKHRVLRQVRSELEGAAGCGARGTPPAGSP